MTTSFVSDFSHERSFVTAKQDAEQYAASLGSNSYMQSSAYRLAYHDFDFMIRDELRPIRLQLELLKAELTLEEHGIDATVVVFGSARIDENSDDYKQARRFGALLTENNREQKKSLVIVTGGGGGIMEAANRGAFEAGGKSIGFNVVLPHEQTPNAYITPDLCFQFHYFAVRKMHLLMRAKALVVFPGGFGTLDELFEALTLIQTKKMHRIPIILFNQRYWNRIVNFKALVEEGAISVSDLDLIQFAESAEQAWELIVKTLENL